MLILAVAWADEPALATPTPTHAASPLKNTIIFIASDLQINRERLVSA
jgi:hypothetical protein